MIDKHFKLVIDYVNGEEIENIDELENNIEFMKLVFKYTKDKRLFNLCSDKIKNDIEFIKFMIELFKNDLDFIINVIEKYLSQKEDNQKEELELTILIRNIIKVPDYDKYLKYFLYTRMAYENDMMEIASLKEYFKDKDMIALEYIQNGFSVIMDKYDYNETILNFYANQYILDLFADKNLEYILHEKFETLKEIEDYDLKKYIIEYLYNYDNCLGEYIESNKYILNQLNSKIKLILARWDMFKELNEYKRYDILVEKTENYIEENNIEVFSPEEVICYFIKKYNLIDFFNEHNVLDYTDYLYFTRDLYIDETILNIQELQHIRNLEKIFLQIVNIKIIRGNDIEIVKEKKSNKSKKLNKCRILKFEKGSK